MTKTFPSKEELLAEFYSVTGFIGRYTNYDPVRNHFESNYIPDRLEFAMKTISFPWTDSSDTLEFIPEIIYAYLRFRELGLEIEESPEYYVDNETREENFKQLMGQYYTEPTPIPTEPLELMKSLVKYAEVMETAYKTLAHFDAYHGFNEECHKIYRCNSERTKCSHSDSF